MGSGQIRDNLKMCGGRLFKVVLLRLYGWLPTKTQVLFSTEIPSNECCSSPCQRGLAWLVNHVEL